MSISSEITRIQNKRDLSFAEVANKGVTVPAGSTIDDLPGLIAHQCAMEGGKTVDIPDLGDPPAHLEVLSPDREVNEADYN